VGFGVGLLVDGTAIVGDGVTGAIVVSDEGLAVGTPLPLISMSH